MKKLLVVFTLLFSSTVFAGPFIDLGLSKQINSIKEKESVCITDWDEDKNEWGCSDDPFGYFSIGYRYKNLTAQIEHWSSLKEKDIGLNLFTIKYRFEYKGWD